MTGAAAKSGNEIKDGTTLAFEKMGYKIGDYKIELVIIDDRSDPAKGVNAYTEAIERLGVQAGVSNWNTAVTVAIQDILRKYKVPHFFCEGAGKAGLDRVSVSSSGPALPDHEGVSYPTEADCGLR